MDWKQYEREIADYFAEEYPRTKITPDARLIGKFSKVERQIDLLVEEQASDFSFRIVIDAKHRGRKIDVTDVEAFLGLVRDVDAHTGVMIALEGYTQAALNRAHYGDEDLILDVLNFSDLKNYQGFLGIPYAGKYGAVVSAPFGWIVDAISRGAALAWMYQRGLTLDDAIDGREFAYINFYRKTDKIRDIDSLCAYQAKYMKQEFPDAEFEYLDGVREQKVGAPTRIRRVTKAYDAGPEYTGFVDFGDFIFMCVLHTRTEVERKNLRKLRAVLRGTVPLKVRHRLARRTKKIEKRIRRSGAR